MGFAARLAPSEASSPGLPEARFAMAADLSKRGKGAWSGVERLEGLWSGVAQRRYHRRIEIGSRGPRTSPETRPGRLIT